MMLVRTYLSNSKIEGIGIFAAEPIKAGDVIWRLDPKFDVLFTESDIEELPPHMQDFISRYFYPHLKQPGVWVLESDNGRFMNHSESPNTDFSPFEEGFAIRDIAAGEELLWDYNLYDDDDPAPCHCGSRKCRGTMYSREWMAKMRRKEARKKKRESVAALGSKAEGKNPGSTNKSEPRSGERMQPTAQAVGS